jgi:hypothetical protein
MTNLIRISNVSSTGPLRIISRTDASLFSISSRPRADLWTGASGQLQGSKYRDQFCSTKMVSSPALLHATVNLTLFWQDEILIPTSQLPSRSQLRTAVREGSHSYHETFTINKTESQELLPTWIITSTLVRTFGMDYQSIN